jgi:ribose transport system ATP-binding protein
MPMPDAAPLLQFDTVSKRFGGTLAVDRVSLDLRPGEILALLGENGAGKSTLIKMLAGIHALDGGEIRFRGAPYRHRAARAGQRQAVAFIHQDLGLIDWMTVAENVAMGVGFPRRAGLVDWRGAQRQAARVLAALGADINPNQRVMNLPRAERSLVAIARALAAEAEVLVLDEPTASLPADEVRRLLTALRGLRATGVGMIYVSHRLDEVFDVADEVAVLRDGRLVGRRVVADTTPAELVTLIVGRPPEQVFARPAGVARDLRLSVRALYSGAVGPADFDLRAGEILGLVGLRGAGHEVISRVLFGLAPIDSGSVTLDGAELRVDGPRAAIAAGIGLVAGDRVAESLGMRLSVRENLFLNPAALGRHVMEWRAPEREVTTARAMGQTVALRPNDPLRPVETLSGGNQQKVVMARWLAVARRLLILEEPTAGVDVGAKAEIYALLNQALAKGLAVLLVSTDFEEVARISHRAIVFGRGRVCAAIDRRHLSVESILHAASAGKAMAA